MKFSVETAFFTWQIPGQYRGDVTGIMTMSSIFALGSVSGFGGGKLIQRKKPT
jgi:hypothetical protein